MAANHEISALVETNTPEEAEAGTIGAAIPQKYLPEAKNFANDEKVKKFIVEQLFPILTWTRSDRQGLEEEWRAIKRMEKMKHDEGRRYLGRSQNYLPVFQKVQQTLITNLARGIFPSDEYLDVTDKGDRADNQNRALAAKAYMKWEFEANAKVKQMMKQFLRPFVGLGIGIVKHRYAKELRTMGKLEKLGTLNSYIGSMKPTPVYEGLCAQARNPFHWYVYPSTISTFEEAKVVFEDIDVTRDYINEMGIKKRWLNVGDALSAPRIAEHDYNVSEQLNEKDLTNPADSVVGWENTNSIRTLTEVWMFMQLPKEAYKDNEDPRLPVPVRLLLAGTVPLEVTRNPMWHQRPPYEVARMNAEPGSFYGYGHGHIVRGLQYLSNDFSNQTNDCGNYVLNPLVKANPGMLAGPLKPIAPGSTWYMTDVHNGAVFDRPPVELIQQGLLMVNYFVSASQDFGGAPPILQGLNAGKGARTATSSQILQRNAMQPVQDVVEDIENDVLVPLMRAAWIYAQQYRDKDVMAVVANERIPVSRDVLMMDADFRWLASSQSANQQQRAQQAMMLMQGIGPLLPAIMQQGYVVDFVPLIRRIYADGFGFRGFEDFIKRASAAPGQGMPMQGQMPGVQQEQGDRIRSALDQLGGGQVEMAPGEGEDFMQVRNNADSLAGMMGAGGGEA